MIKPGFVNGDEVDNKIISTYISVTEGEKGNTRGRWRLWDWRKQTTKTKIVTWRDRSNGGIGVMNSVQDLMRILARETSRKGKKGTGV